MVEPLFIRMKDLPKVVGLSRTEIYRQIAAGRFPAPIKLGTHASAWTPESLQEWKRSVLAESVPV